MANTTITTLKKLLMLCLIIGCAVTYGVFAQYKSWFPAPLINALKANAVAFVDEYLNPWYYKDANSKQRITVSTPEAIAPGLTKITAIDGNKKLAISIVDPTGAILHKWEIDWFELWPEPDHLVDINPPFLSPGTIIHGDHLFDNGDIVFNFENLGMIKLDFCGNVLWRLDERTHHSIDVSGNSIWTSINQYVRGEELTLPQYKNHYLDSYIAEISTNGEVIQKVNITELLQNNHLTAMLYLASNRKVRPLVNGDTLHINDVEVYPSDLPEGFFKAGDIMVSIRNTNSILIFSSDFTLKHQINNLTLRQHDPDFIDGNTISIYDNNPMFEAEDPDAFSMITVVQVPENIIQIAYQGTPNQPFFSEVMGKHQWLDNGNILITESVQGRVIEVNRAGDIVWEFHNLVDDLTVAAVQEAQRLPDQWTNTYVSQLSSQCQQ